MRKSSPEVINRQRVDTQPILSPVILPKEEVSVALEKSTIEKTPGQYSHVLVQRIDVVSSSKKRLSRPLVK